MYQVLLIIYPIIAIALIAFILVQQGKGADMGASFGAGASGTVFGASGAGNFLTRTTTILAIVFFAISLLLGNLTAHSSKPKGNFDDLSGVAQQVKEEAAKPVTELPEKQDVNQDIPK
ncbi:preprotein translocase subunit SecG [Gallibacterium anatis]|uniref:preprotein translocase subunit SecG n=1 Tax=Gallibacterium anatis TaxID=750 RepID=UPI000531D6AA|nr:preprotein translocase subunit SecG [Gallibacterium anatis]KGQ26656.1 preprotein translocase subunit SecG [Gallibacterium anatis]KGQ27809.1 preprotein translocase subunit SecG [Gallibacterium anatis]